MVLQQAPKKSAVWGYADLDKVGSQIKANISTGDDNQVHNTYSAVVRKGKYVIYFILTWTQSSWR